MAPKCFSKFGNSEALKPNVCSSKGIKLSAGSRFSTSANLKQENFKKTGSQRGKNIF